MLFTVLNVTSTKRHNNLIYKLFLQIEPSHKTWKNFMKFDFMTDMDDFMKNTSETELDWVTALPVYQHL